MGIEKGESKKLTKREEELLQKVAERLREIRKEKGFTSYENLAFEKGIPRMTIYRLEAAKDFNFSSLVKVLDSLDISLKEFFDF